MPGLPSREPPTDHAGVSRWSKLSKQLSVLTSQNQSDLLLPTSDTQGARWIVGVCVFLGGGHKDVCVCVCACACKCVRVRPLARRDRW